MIMKAPEKIYLTQLMLFATPTIRSSDNEVDACYEMIIRLHELNLL